MTNSEEEPKTWVDQAAESVRNLPAEGAAEVNWLPMYENRLKLPEEILSDPRVAEPIREIAALTGASVQEVEEALMALLTPRTASKRRH